MIISDKKTSEDTSNNLPGSRWLLHRSPWKPTPVKSYADIPNDTELPAFFEELMNETGKNHLVFKLKPIKVLEGVPTVQNQRARRARHTATKRSETPGSQKTRRQRRDVTVRMPERKVETLVVIDRKMMEYHKSKEMLQPYVLTIMNIVSSLKLHIYTAPFQK